MIQQRYFALCIVPACLLAARLASSLADFGRGRKWLRMAVVSSLVLAVAATLHLTGRQRGFIYHVAEKESYLTAVYAIRTRYSEALPVLDFGSGWTSDLGACRALLRARDSRGDRQGFEESLQSRSKLRNHVAEFTSVSGRYAAVGHGEWLGSVEGRALVSSAEKRKQRIEKIGRYFPLRRGDLRKWWWLPREMAVRRALLNSAIPARPANDIDKRAYLDAYLVTPKSGK